MTAQITKKDLKELSSTIIEAVEHRLLKMEERMDTKYAKEETLRGLTVTLDNFLKQMSDYKEEFIILKSEVDRIKSVLKDKLGVDIARL